MSRCIAQTTKGRQCKQKVVEEFEYCARHKELYVDLVAEMEVVKEANKAREEKLKQKIDKLEKLLVRANEKAAADNAGRQEMMQHQVHSQKQEGGGDGRCGGWMVLGLLVLGGGSMWWRQRRC